MNYPKIFFYSCLSFIIGVFIRSVFSFSFFVSFVILLISCLFFVLTLKNKYFFILGLWGIFLVFGFVRYDLAIPKITKEQISFYNGQQVQLIGLISKEPDNREDRVRLEISSQKIILINNQEQAVNGKVLVTNYLFPEYNYGDQVRLICNLQAPEQINDFAYDKYLARYDIYSLCYYPQITVLKQDQGNKFLAVIYKGKNYFVSQLNKALPEPQSSFLAGLLIGAKKSIPADLQAVFNKTGTTHIVAVSGYNITIIAAFLLALMPLLGLGRKKSFWLIIFSLFCFMILTGLQASIVRATIMGGLVLLAGYLGRLSKINNALALTAVIMLLVNPKILVYDLGFQLSFLATLGLVYLNPVLSQILKIKNLKLKIVQVILGDYLLTTISAIIMTQPLILYQFGKVALIAPLANILVLPFIPIAMLLGFIVGLLALIWTGLGWVAGWSVWLVLTYIIWVLEKLAGLNWAYYEFSKINVWLMVGLYFLITAFIWKFKKV